MAQAEYDSAIQTIRQGLLLDNNNSQLMKQLRLAQQQKKVVTAKQHSLATALQQQQPAMLPNTDGVMTTLDPATASEYQELQNQYTLLSRDYNTIQADVIKSQRETKVADITCQELQKINDETNTACYRSIGKLFVKGSKTEMTEQLQQRQLLEEQSITENTKKLEYMERQLTSIRQNINEIIQKSQ
jgi:chaperonin cofactor prefoldin